MLYFLRKHLYLTRSSYYQLFPTFSVIASHCHNDISAQILFALYDPPSWVKIIFVLLNNLPQDSRALKNRSVSLHLHCKPYGVFCLNFQACQILNHSSQGTMIATELKRPEKQSELDNCCSGAF